MRIDAHLAHPDLAPEIAFYMTVRDAMPESRFLRTSVIAFAVDPGIIHVEDARIAEPVLLRSLTGPAQSSSKDEGLAVFVQCTGTAFSRLGIADPGSVDGIQPAPRSDYPQLHSLLEELRACEGDDAAMVETLDAFFLPRMKQASPRGLAERFRAELVAEPDTSLADLSARHGKSERTIQRAFKTRFGITPREYRSLSRLNISTSGKLGSKLRWRDVSPDAHYADQSHWIREFRHFRGTTPSAFSAHTPDWWHYHERSGKVLRAARDAPIDFAGSDWEAQMALFDTRRDLDRPVD